jgi:hypothetical protein
MSDVIRRLLDDRAVVTEVLRAATGRRVRTARSARSRSIRYR